MSLAILQALEAIRDDGVEVDFPEVQEVSGLKLQYKGEEYKALAGTSFVLTLPTGTNTFQIDAEGGAVYYAVNSAGDASATGGGYVPQDAVRFEGPLTSLTGVKIFGAVGAKAHVKYYAG